MPDQAVGNCQHDGAVIHKQRGKEMNGAARCSPSQRLQLLFYPPPPFVRQLVRRFFSTS
jgi:hypothetical protein